MDPHSFYLLDLDPDQHSEKLLDLDPHSEKLLDSDPQKINADPQPCFSTGTYVHTGTSTVRPFYCECLVCWRVGTICMLKFTHLRAVQ